MLNKRRNTGGVKVSGVFVRTIEEYRRIRQNAEPEESAGSVYLTEDAELAGKLSGENVPVILVEQEEGNHDYQIEYVWQSDERPPSDEMPDQEYLDLVWHRWNGLPLTIAETERLLIRESVMEDLEAFRLCYEQEKGNRDVEPLGDEPEVSLENYIKGQYPLFGYGLWTVVEKETGMVLGRAGIEQDDEGNASLAYLIRREERGKGYAKEACEAILAAAFDELELECIFLRTDQENTQSQKLAQSLGFQAVSRDDTKGNHESQTIDRYRKKLYIRCIDNP